jgi:hypothetical protein
MQDRTVKKSKKHTGKFSMFDIQDVPFCARIYDDILGAGKTLRVKIISNITGRKKNATTTTHPRQIPEILF